MDSSKLRLDVQNLLRRADEIQIIKDEDKLYTILGELENLTDEQKKAIFAQSRTGGGVFLFESRHFPGHIVEYVPGVMVNDGISTMFAPHQTLAQARLLLQLREELVLEIERVSGATRGALRKVDHARHRDLLLEEMATMQLVDTLRERARLH